MQPGIQDGYIPAQCFGILEQHSESRMSQLSRLGDPYDAHPRTVLRNLQYNAFRTAVAAKLQNIHIPVQRLSRYRSAIVASFSSLGDPSDALGFDLSCNGTTKLCTHFSMPGILDSSILCSAAAW